jgi:Glutamyl-tRNAGlu reductase, N-terminal domain
MELIGHYKDHSMFDPYRMAVHSAAVKHRMQSLAAQGLLLLTTCLRVELYGDRAAVQTQSTDLIGNPKGSLFGTDEVAQRLSEIAAGTRSQILGESYIGEQISQVVDLLPPYSPMRRLASLAIEIGKEAQTRYSFFASADYDKIVLDLINEAIGMDGIGGTLYLVGAGMLGRSILLGELPRRFRTTRIISRDPKGLRRKLRGLTIPPIEVGRADNLKPAKESNSVVVIATNEVADTYRSTLEALFWAIEPSRIIELSSLPAFASLQQRSGSYVNMYSDKFKRILAVNNEALASRLEPVKVHIREAIREARSHDRDLFESGSVQSGGLHGEVLA